MVTGEILHWLQLVGVGVFALTGALAAARRKLDIFGFALLGSVTGIGGGTLRDVLLDVGPVFWVADPAYILVCVAVSTIAFFGVPYLARSEKILLWADALGMALFCVLGAERALEAGAFAGVAMVMGVIVARTWWAAPSGSAAQPVYSATPSSSTTRALDPSGPLASVR